MQSGVPLGEVNPFGVEASLAKMHCRKYGFPCGMTVSCLMDIHMAEQEILGEVSLSSFD